MQTLSQASQSEASIYFTYLIYKKLSAFWNRHNDNDDDDVKIYQIVKTNSWIWYGQYRS